MVRPTHKLTSEKPNTPSVIVWPTNFNENKRKLTRRERLNSQDSDMDESVNEESSTIDAVNKSLLRERLEFYAIFILGGIIWCTIVHKVLKAHKFPFHLHRIAVTSIMLGPIIMMLLLLLCLDSILKQKADWFLYIKKIGYLQEQVIETQWIFYSFETSRLRIYSTVLRFTLIPRIFENCNRSKPLISSTTWNCPRRKCGLHKSCMNQNVFINKLISDNPRDVN